jgi:hypothetical protein
VQYAARQVTGAGYGSHQPSAVRQLLAEGFLPAVKVPNGRIYFRRPQLHVVAKARNERYHPDRAVLAARAKVAVSNRGVAAR